MTTAQALCRDGSALLGSGDLAGALAYFEAALAQEPDFDFASLCLVHALSLSADCSPQRYLQAARAHGARLAAAAVPYTDWPLPYVPTVECSADAPLRVGLVSGNFHEHPVGYFLESLVQALSPQRTGARPTVQLFAYANRSDEDALTARLRPGFTHWEAIAGADDAAVARKIHSHGLHVLIDLDGYTDGNRLGVFAWRPAPLQISWLGYWASTGLDAMDAVLADRFSLPPALEGQFSEAIAAQPFVLFVASRPKPTDGVHVAFTTCPAFTPCVAFARFAPGPHHLRVLSNPRQDHRRGLAHLGPGDAGGAGVALAAGVPPVAQRDFGPRLGAALVGGGHRAGAGRFGPDGVAP
jgi:protein O-GlcNAc transferase